MHKKTVVIVCGPTAIGKTSVALQLALEFNTQIISADSRQCFKELNIGVAKPTDKELAQVTHYFINSHSIKDEVNAASFETYAIAKVEEIFAGNTIAVMVGGTGLYIKAFCEGLDHIPTIPIEIRNNITQQYLLNGLAWLQKQVQEKDPTYWHIAEQQNPQRLMRALEVFETTGNSINHYKSGSKANRDFNIIKIGLETTRNLLYQNINERIDEMMQNGLVNEVKSLLPYKKLNALQTVGYKEIFNYLEGVCTLEEAIELLKKNTRHYSKRQITWFKKDEQIQWFQPNELSKIIAFIKNKI